MTTATPDIFTEYEASVENSPTCEHSEHHRSKFHADDDKPLWEVLVWCRYCGTSDRVLFCDHWVRFFQAHPKMRLSCNNCPSRMTPDETYLVIGNI
jgi:hypothetical protein